MLPKEYIENVLKTESNDFIQIQERLSNNSCIRLLHTSMGLQTESAEFTDTLKKYIFYGKSIDGVNLAEELGDICWYLAIACNELGLSFEGIWQNNINKLYERYGISFNEEGAINRDLSAERYILEKDNLNYKDNYIHLAQYHTNNKLFVKIVCKPVPGYYRVNTTNNKIDCPNCILIEKREN